MVLKLIWFVKWLFCAFIGEEWCYQISLWGWTAFRWSIEKDFPVWSSMLFELMNYLLGTSFLCVYIIDFSIFIFWGIKCKAVPGSRFDNLFCETVMKPIFKPSPDSLSLGWIGSEWGQKESYLVLSDIFIHTSSISWILRLPLYALVASGVYSFFSCLW